MGKKILTYAIVGLTLVILYFVNVLEMQREKFERREKQ